LETLGAETKPNRRLSPPPYQTSQNVENLEAHICTVCNFKNKESNFKGLNKALQRKAA
jgi:hypothetical protein